MTSLTAAWVSLLSFLPQLLGAVLILVLGFILANLLAAAVRRLVALTRVDEWIERQGVNRAVQSTGQRITISGALAWLVKWFVIIFALISASNALGLTQVTAFLNQVAGYIPNVAVAVIILAIGTVVGSFAESLVVSAMVASRISPTSAGMLGAIARYAIMIFAILAALVQLQVASSLVQILFTGLVAMLAIAGGIAFGFGGQDQAHKWLDKLEHEIERR
jgi:hypothetical protein